MPNSITIEGTISPNNSSTFKFIAMLKIKLNKKNFFYDSVLAVSLQIATSDNDTWEQKVAVPIVSQLKLSTLYRSSRFVQLSNEFKFPFTLTHWCLYIQHSFQSGKNMVFSAQGT